MRTKHQTIEINGRTYDAVSGHTVGGSPSTPGYVDGIIKNPSPSIPEKSVKAPTGSRSLIGSSNKVHQKAQASHTLMRSGLKKPAKTSISAVAVADQAAVNTYSGSTGSIFDGISPLRKKRAENTARSGLVSRFSNFGSDGDKVVKTTAPLEVRLEPGQTEHHASDKTNDTSQTEPDEAKKKGLFKRRAGRQRSSKRRKAARVGAMALSAALVAAFIVYQQMPNISLRVAAARAGFSARMPGHTPSGFAFTGPINYSPGQVTISFKSNSDDRNYSVQEKPTNWDSDALLNNYVATTNQPYQQYQDRGRTIYMYNDSSATWVDGGVWYQISGENGSLSSNQLLGIANSL